MIDKSILETGDLIFTYQHSLLNRLILYFSRQDIKSQGDFLKIAHVGMYIKVADKIYEANKTISLSPFKKYTNKKYTLYFGKVKNIQLDSYHLFKLSRFIDITLDTKYSYIQLAAILFKKIFNWNKTPDIQKEKYICSELLCHAVYNVWGIKLLKDFSGCSPLDLYLSSQVEKISDQGPHSN